MGRRAVTVDTVIRRQAGQVAVHIEPPTGSTLSLRNKRNALRRIVFDPRGVDIAWVRLRSGELRLRLTRRTWTEINDHATLPYAAWPSSRIGSCKVVNARHPAPR